MFVKRFRLFVVIFLTGVISITLYVLSFSHFAEKPQRLSGFGSFQTPLRGYEARSSLRTLERDSRVKIHPFNISGHDVMIFLHIQKTSGSHFGHKLVKNLQLSKRPCTTINRR